MTNKNLTIFHFALIFSLGLIQTLPAWAKHDLVPGEQPAVEKQGLHPPGKEGGANGGGGCLGLCPATSYRHGAFASTLGGNLTSIKERDNEFYLDVDCDARPEDYEIQFRMSPASDPRSNDPQHTMELVQETLDKDGVGSMGRTSGMSYGKRSAFNGSFTVSLDPQRDLFVFVYFIDAFEGFKRASSYFEVVYKEQVVDRWIQNLDHSLHYEGIVVRVRRPSGCQEARG